MLHPEAQAGFPALLVLLIGILVFHGSVYLLVALNLGWRFGYWVTGATMGGLMLFLSVFWITNALGPRGEEPLWYPIATAKQAVGSVEWSGKTLTEPASYPGGAWKTAEKPTDPLSVQVDAIKAAISNCVSFGDETKVEEAKTEIAKLGGPTRNLLEGRFGKETRLKRELETCEQASSFLPSEDEIPKIDGQPASVVQDVTDIRFAEESGLLLGEVTVVPNTYDKRVTGDPEGLKPLRVGEPFKILAYRDPGSLRYPSFVYLFLSTVWLLFHLWGLSRAERKKLTPVA